MMKWKRISNVRSRSSEGYLIEVMNNQSPFVYVVWPPVKENEQCFKFPHEIIRTFSTGSDLDRVNKAKQFCEVHFEKGRKNAA